MTYLALCLQPFTKMLIYRMLSCLHFLYTYKLRHTRLGCDYPVIHVALFSMLSLSAHGGGGCERGRRADAGGDLWPHPAHHRSGEPRGRHRARQPAGEATGPLRLLGRVLGMRQRATRFANTIAIAHWPNRWCGSSLKVVQTVLDKTSSGGFCSNDGIVHMCLPSLPFGGIGRWPTLLRIAFKSLK